MVPLSAASSTSVAPLTSAFGDAAVLESLERCDLPAWIIGEPTRAGLRLGVLVTPSAAAPAVPANVTQLGMLPALHAEWLGDRGFNEEHGTRYPYVVGSMATGIASVDIVVAAARAGFLAFFGAGGLGYATVEKAVGDIQARLADMPNAAWGANLIHSPDQPALEDKLIDLYLARGVTRIETSAFMALAPSIVRYSATGLTQDAWGRIIRRNRVMAKISRPEVARHFLQPPPQALLDDLVARGALSAEEARLAALVPIADDVTCEADSGGHTDRRPMSALFPVIRRLREELAPAGGWPRPVRIGIGGGVADPDSAAAAFALGADYIVTGTINQTAVESGTSDIARQMLAQAGLADVIMAPAADMFELGVEVQVLRRGTLFAQRGKKLYDVYRAHQAWTDVPAALRAQIEKDILRAPFDDIWAECVRFWTNREPAQVARAEADPQHKMALVFRWYLGNSNRWAREGVADRRNDFQIWCGPAIGAFNAWTAGSHLADPARRTVADIGLNLLAGAVRCTRINHLRAAGVPVPTTAYRNTPVPMTESV
jgi:trans-AT polyketide synthase/acyltransferase/oxidoreductase domain-containing protein